MLCGSKEKYRHVKDLHTLKVHVGVIRYDYVVHLNSKFLVCGYCIFCGIIFLFDDLHETWDFKLNI